MSRRLGEYAASLAGWLVEETDHACRAMYQLHRQQAVERRPIDPASGCGVMKG